MTTDNTENANETASRKTRPDDVLGNLPPEKKNRIIRWLGEMGYDEVLVRIAEPEPHGLGIKTHYTSLRRFYTKNMPDDLMSHRREEMLQLRGLAEACEGEPAPYDTLIREFFTKGVFYQSLGQPHQDPGFRDSMRLLLELRAQELKEKHFQLQRDRFERSEQVNPKSDVTLQIFAGFQAQIEQMLAKTLPHGASNALDDRRPQSLIVEANPSPEPLPDNSAVSTEKHDLAPNNTI